MRRRQLSLQADPFAPFAERKANQARKSSNNGKRSSTTSRDHDPVRPGIDAAIARLLDTTAAMASKLTPFLMRTVARAGSRAAWAMVPVPARTLSTSATRRSDTLMVVSLRARDSSGEGEEEEACD